MSAAVSTRPDRTTNPRMKASRLSMSSSAASTSSSSYSAMMRRERESTSSSANRARCDSISSVSGRWVEDDESARCTKCERPFTLVNRRHHCRICGEIFCNTCSRTRMMIALAPDDTARKLRVCDHCAAHAQSSAVVFDDEANATTLRKTTLEAKNAEMEAEATKPVIVAVAEPVRPQDPSVNFMLASMVCFAAAFWFLKDEVSRSNPAIWILLAGFLKNLHQLVISVRPCGFARVPKAQPTEFMAPTTELASVREGEEAPMLDVIPVQVQQKPKIDLTEPLRQELLNKAKPTIQKVWDIATSEDKWTPEQLTFPLDDVQLYSRDDKPSRTFKVDTYIDLPPEELFDLLYTHFEESVEWNVTADKNVILEKLSDDIDLVHMTTIACLGGTIGSRDFVNTRAWQKYNGAYVVSMVYAGKQFFKPEKGVTRGENGLTGFVIMPDESSPYRCHLLWIVNCDIKIFLPSSLVRKGSISECCCFIRNLRRHLAAKMANNENVATPIET